MGTPFFNTKIMTSENKLRKINKKLHWGRGGRFLKAVGKGVKRLDFFNASQRKINNTKNYDWS